MKTLPDAIIAGMRGNSERVILVRIIPESGDTWGELLWATRDITITDWEGGGTMKTFKGGVLKENQLGTISQSVDIRQGGNVAMVSSLTLNVVNSEYNAGNRFDQIFTGNLESREVEIRLVFWTGSNPAWSDTLLLYRGIIEDVDYDYGIYKIKVRDAGFKRHKEIPDLILDENSYPKVPESNKGAVVPLVYGAPAFGNLFYVDDIYRAPAYKSNREKEEYLISRNKTSDAVGEARVFVYFSDINRYGVIYLSSGSFSIAYERPTKLSFPLDVILKGKFYSQGEAQGSQTNPTSIDFHNAVDDDLNSYLTLGNSEKLYLKFPMPSDFAEIISGMTTIQLRVRFGTITGSAHPAVAGRLKYYNPDDDTFSSGQTFTVDDSNDINFAYSVSLTWDQLQRFEFGITMESDATAQIKNIWIEMNNMLIRGIIVPPPHSTFAHYHTTQTGEPRLTAEIKEYGAKFKTPLMIYNFVNGERFGAWIDADSRDNGYNENHLPHYGAYIIETMLRSELGLTSNEIDYEAFDEVGNTTNGNRKDWMFDGIIEKQRNSLDIFAEFCRQAGIIYYENYENKATIRALKKQTPIKTVDRTTIQENIIHVSLSRLDEIYNEFYLYYRRMNNDNYGSMLFVTASDHNLSSNTRSGTPNTYTGLCSDSQDKYKQTKRFNFKCDWINDNATAELLIKWLAEWFCYRKYIVEFKTDGLDHINLEMGDQIKIDHTLLPTGVSNDASFLLFDISHDLDNDKMKFEFMQIPDLLP